jgi:hypothetical protein
LCIEDDVIVVSPKRALYVARILRNSVVRIHQLGQSQTERKGKMDRLYQYIPSEQYSRRFAEAGRLADEIQALDVQEQKDHATSAQ